MWPPTNGKEQGVGVYSVWQDPADQCRVHLPRQQQLTTQTVPTGVKVMTGAPTKQDLFLLGGKWGETSRTSSQQLQGYSVSGQF